MSSAQSSLTALHQPQTFSSNRYASESRRPDNLQPPVANSPLALNFISLGRPSANYGRRTQHVALRVRPDLGHLCLTLLQTDSKLKRGSSSLSMGFRADGGGIIDRRELGLTNPQERTREKLLRAPLPYKAKSLRCEHLKLCRD